jgi:hypothetical protein
LALHLRGVALAAPLFLSDLGVYAYPAFSFVKTAKNGRAFLAV